MGILTLISSQRQPKMDSEGDSESSEFEEKAGRKILLAKKKVPPHSGRDTWQKLRLPTSQVYTLENANSNFLSKPTHCSTTVALQYRRYRLITFSGGTLGGVIYPFNF